MKSALYILFTALLSCISTLALSQAPGKFNYQAVIRNGDGSGAAHQDIDMRFQLFDAAVLGEQVYEEEFLNVNTGNFGVLNLQIGGNGNVDLKSLDWGGRNYYVNIQIRQGATPYADISINRMPLVSVPFALNAHKADTATYALTTGTPGGTSDGNLISADVITDTLLLIVSDGSGGRDSITVQLPGGDNWGNQVVLRNSTLKGTGAGSDSLGLADMGATQGQVLKWTNGRWAPGIDLSSGSVIPDNQTLEGDGTIGIPLRIKNLGVTNTKLAANSVTTDKIQDGEIQSNDLSDMGAAVGETLVYRLSGWRPEPLPPGGSSHWTKEGINLFVNNGEYVGINTSSPEHPGLTILDGDVSLYSDFGSGGVVSASSYMSPGSLAISSANSIISTSNAILNPNILTIQSGGFAGGGPYGIATVTPLLMKIQSFEALSAVENSLHQDGSGSGFSTVYGENGSRNVRLTNLLVSPNNGFVGVYDANETLKAGLIVNSLNEGEIFADVKNFRIPNPRDLTTDIWYACIEGPEAAAYERGTATLINGEAFVPFSDHFQSVINSQTLTVVLTSHSSDTYGLAVIEKLPTGIHVKEFKGGTGSFSFDWEVKGVRKGYEDYQVIRNKDYGRPE